MSQRPGRFLGATLYRAGLILSAAVAVTLSVFLPAFYREWNPGGTSGYVGLPSIFLVIEPLIVVAAWIAVWAWLRRRWILSGLCLLATIFGPWGINFVLAVIPLGLGILVLVRGLVSVVRGQARASVDRPAL